MPKHGWKWRTEQVRALSSDELEMMLRDPDVRISAKLGRWIFENLPGESYRNTLALERIAEDAEAPWTNAYLWRLLEKYKSESFGDWVIIALTRWGAEKAEDVDKFIDLYEDETAHPLTRGSAVFGINNCVQISCYWPEVKSERYFLHESAWGKIRATCAKALQDEQNPYARAGACWLAQSLGCFEDELKQLVNDHTKILPDSGLTVADHID